MGRYPDNDGGISFPHAFPTTADRVIFSTPVQAELIGVYGSGYSVRMGSSLYVGGNAYLQNGGAAYITAGAGGPASQSGFNLGSAQDVNLYRSGAGVLTTDDIFTAPSVIVQNATSQHVEIGIDRKGGGQAQINFGAAQDVNLYRDGADILKTDDSLRIAGALAHQGTTVGLYGVPTVVRAAPIASPAGGAVIDAQSRAAIDSIRAALTNIGITG